MATKNIHITAQLGEGIYSIYDISKILKLPYHKVRGYFQGFWKGYTFGEKGNRAVNFWTLIEFYTFYKLRESGVKPSVIKKAHSAISKHLNTPYPFASDTIKSDGKGVWYNLLELLINADGSQQINIETLVEPFLSNVTFDDNKLATQYYPFPSKNIVVDPKYQFGQPVISGTRIKAEILNDYYKAGESVETISQMYSITKEQVEDAISYFNFLAA